MTPVPIDKDPNNEKLPKELQECLRSLVDKYEQEDGWVRKQQIKLWKKNDEFWHGIQFIFWSESRQDWVSPTGSTMGTFQQNENRENSEGPFYDYVVNIYKAHGESIIAALATQLPGVRFPPDDADDDEDISTSRAYDKIADLVQRHNQATILFLKALFTLWNQGLVCAYHAPKEDRAFGTVKIPKYKQGLSCKTCDQQFPVDEENNDRSCPQCGNEMEDANVLDGFDDSPKTRVLIDIFGPLHVKVPYTAREQEDFGYLILALDQPKAFHKHIFPHIADEIGPDFTDSQQFERMARAPSSYSATARIDENRNLSTLRRVWLRPWVFEDLSEDKEEEKKKLQELFPHGCYVGFVGTVYAESRDEDMDKYWTLGKAGMSTYIHADAMGQPLVPIQEMRNVLVNLSLETIEQGIPDTFADPDVLDFETYSRHERRPGTVYPAKPKMGQNLPSSFFEGSRASLSAEVPAFGQELDRSGQFVVGSFPSIYGGTQDAKSRTAAEYNMSRQMALQRLTITWKLITKWWAMLMEKCVHIYIENMLDDEHYVKMEDNNYVNVWIRRAELTGHVGEVEPEGSDSFPTSMPQKQQMFMKLIELNIPELRTALFDPANRKTFADLLGFPEMEIPGENQRVKQSRETSEMIKGNNGQGVFIPINPDVDEHEIHIFTLKNFLCDEVGLDLQRKNPQAYNFLIQHLKAHEQIDQQEKDSVQQKQIKSALALEDEKGKMGIAREQTKGQNKIQEIAMKHKGDFQKEILKNASQPPVQRNNPVGQ